MNLDKYIQMENTQIPETVRKILSKKGGITKTEFSDKNNVLKYVNLQNKCGYDKMADGSYLVSMNVPMPNVTKEMVKWWFWWHTSDSERYKAWYPKEHIANSYAKKDKEYFQSTTVPKFQPNTQYPVERVGSLIAPLSIDFVSPTDFGFLEDTIKKSNVECIVCGHVGAFKGLIPNTEMAHILVTTDDGPVSVSRFWLGKSVKNKFIRKMFLTEKQARGMAEHCYVEYNNFAIKIPQMYNEWLNEQYK
ncbi:MAG: hypothetical protein R3Y12_08605 [Clostridia bacterium]